MLRLTSVHLLIPTTTTRLHKPPSRRSLIADDDDDPVVSKHESVHHVAHILQSHPSKGHRRRWSSERAEKKRTAPQPASQPTSMLQPVWNFCHLSESDPHEPQVHARRQPTGGDSKAPRGRISASSDRDDDVPRVQLIAPGMPMYRFQPFLLVFNKYFQTFQNMHSLGFVQCITNFSTLLDFYRRLLSLNKTINF